jgi:hypothetical protein
MLFLVLSFVVLTMIDFSIHVDSVTGDIISRDAAPDPDIVSASVFDPTVVSSLVPDPAVTSSSVSDPAVTSSSVSDPAVVSSSVSDPAVVSETPLIVGGYFLSFPDFRFSF